MPPTPPRGDPALLARLGARDQLRIVAVGSVDDGKSTLIGRLLQATGGVSQDQLEEATRGPDRTLDLSRLTDGLLAERAQGITLDVAHRGFRTPRRAFLLADAPGHTRHTRHMLGGASTAQVALVLIDAEAGVGLQTKRHALLASLLGLEHVVVCVNKMDLVGWRQDAFARVRDAFLSYARGLGLAGVRCVPLSALRGDHVATRSARMPWHQGPPLLELLEALPVPDAPTALRFPVQLVLNAPGFRGLAGQLTAGELRPGDAVRVLPSGAASRVARIAGLDGDLPQACAPQSVTLVLEDALEVRRGDMLVGLERGPQVLRELEVTVVWLADAPLRVGTSYALRHTTRTTRARVTALHHTVDVETLTRRDADALALHEIGCVTLACDAPLCCDPYRADRRTGSLVLVDPETGATLGAGVVEPLPACELKPADD